MDAAFVLVPETHLPCGRVVPAFEVGRFLCSRDPEYRAPHAAITADAAPWVRVTYLTAVEACLSAGWSLITESQWLAIAHDVCRVHENWSGKKFGVGRLAQGLRRVWESHPVSGMYQPELADDHRWKTLSNGSQICDFGGNAWSWVWDDVQGGPGGLAGVVEEDSPSLRTAPFGSKKSGMGQFPTDRQQWDGRALIRGGGWRCGKEAGAFALYAASLFGKYLSVGFRATRPVGG